MLGRHHRDRRPPHLARGVGGGHREGGGGGAVVGAVRGAALGDLGQLRRDGLERRRLRAADRVLRVAQGGRGGGGDGVAVGGGGEAGSEPRHRRRAHQIGRDHGQGERAGGRVQPHHAEAQAGAQGGGCTALARAGRGGAGACRRGRRRGGGACGRAAAACGGGYGRRLMIQTRSGGAARGVAPALRWRLSTRGTCVRERRKRPSRLLLDRSRSEVMRWFPLGGVALICIYASEKKLIE
mmetsp:Transcript_14388/g.46458  ORF Transcript_14388/g.46458 Transcript_14388/m.46458 type:complete len:239 (-) Transcript_14388:8-724(-)